MSKKEVIVYNLLAAILMAALLLCYWVATVATV